ncbi:aminodeoxychorismate lyase [Metabacillus herbersteinensis]|uniref:Aminodeoxychorismate lyase n=1 Tax=Metabacillus herbersteinensis TaxID=283816 RepID=A0ABV6GKT4_9BACI
MYIYLNSEFVKASEARISPFDHGFLYGMGVFETFRVYQGFPFLLNDHLTRLHQSLVELNIPIELEMNEVRRVIAELIQLNNLEDQDISIRLNVSAGVGRVGHLNETYEAPSVIYYVRPAPHLTDQTEIKATLLKINRNTPEGDYRLKSHHYLNNILGKRELQGHLSDEGIFLTKEGFVAEGIVSNIFWVKDNKVYTPSVHTGILNGITRQFVMKCLTKHNISVYEGFYTREELLNADEVFLTNSGQEVLAVKMVDDVPFYGRNGEVTHTLQKMYAQYHQRLLSINEL